MRLGPLSALLVLWVPLARMLVCWAVLMTYLPASRGELWFVRATLAEEAAGVGVESQWVTRSSCYQMMRCNRKCIPGKSHAYPQQEPG